MIRSFFYFLFLILSTTCFGQTICLNMIVKNERDIIARCLESLKPQIDYWVIVDTGSSDGTQEVIRQCMRDIPGELHERPWVNFGHNRNEAKALAAGKGDYLLFIDADETASFAEGFQMPQLDQDCYAADFIDNEQNLRFTRLFLLKNKPSFFWEGAVHEVMRSTEEGYSAGYLRGVECYTNSSESNRSKDPNKHSNDAKLLEEEIAKDPTCKRNYFYLGQSYFNAGEFEKALRAYQQRADFGDANYQEVFWSLFAVGLIKERLNYGQEEVIASYERAYANRPTRVEPLFNLAHYLLRIEQPQRAYEIARKGIELKRPDDLGYLDEACYRYKMALAFAEAAVQLKKWDEVIHMCRRLLAVRDIPESVRQRAEQGIAICFEQKKRCPLSVATVFSNSASDLTQWIERNKQLGVGHFYLYDNGSTDNYKAVLRPYINCGDVTLINAVKGSQKAIYDDLLTRTKSVTDWVVVLNTDEYISSERMPSVVSVLEQYRHSFPALELNGGKAVIVRPMHCTALGKSARRCRYTGRFVACPIAQEELNVVKASK